MEIQLQFWISKTIQNDVNTHPIKSGFLAWDIPRNHYRKPPQNAVNIRYDGFIVICWMGASENGIAMEETTNENNETIPLWAFQWMETTSPHHMTYDFNITTLRLHLWGILPESPSKGTHTLPCPSWYRWQEPHGPLLWLWPQSYEDWATNREKSHWKLRNLIWWVRISIGVYKIVTQIKVARRPNKDPRDISRLEFTNGCLGLDLRCTKIRMDIQIQWGMFPMEAKKFGFCWKLPRWT